MFASIADFRVESVQSLQDHPPRVVVNLQAPASRSPLARTWKTLRSLINFE